LRPHAHTHTTNARRRRRCSRRLRKIVPIEAGRSDDDQEKQITGKNIASIIKRKIYKYNEITRTRAIGLITKTV
jgi:hypothetical protein